MWRWAAKPPEHLFPSHVCRWANMNFYLSFDSVCQAPWDKAKTGGGEMTLAQSPKARRSECGGSCCPGWRMRGAACVCGLNYRLRLVLRDSLFFFPGRIIRSYFCFLFYFEESGLRCCRSFVKNTAACRRGVITFTLKRTKTGSEMTF